MATMPCPDICTPWATAADLCGDCDGLAQNVTEPFLLAASNLLYHLSGRQWPGHCQETVRPWTRGDDERSGYGRWGYGNERLSLYDRLYGCGTVRQIEMDSQPVVSIAEVLIDGVAVDPARYTVWDHRWLVYLPDPTDPTGRQGWPAWQDHYAPATEANTWQVTYTYGAVPGRAGVLAVAGLACELYKACTPEAAGECRLDPSVTRVTRQGVSFDVEALAMQLERSGRTGISEVDLWLDAVNPHRLSMRATAGVPGRNTRVRRWTA